MKTQLVNALKDEMGYDDNRPRCRDCVHYKFTPVPEGTQQPAGCHYNNIGVITDIDPQAVCDKFNRLAPVAPMSAYEQADPYDHTVNMRTK